MRWARDHPEHFPGARFELAHPQGWATHGKLALLAGDDAACFAAFDRAEAGYLRRPPVGNGICRASQRMILTGNKFVPTMRPAGAAPGRSEEHTSELQSLMRISYAVFCLKKKTHRKIRTQDSEITRTTQHTQGQ